MIVMRLPKVKVADEVWIATALLHMDQPDSVDFTVDQIVNSARMEVNTEEHRPGVYQHAQQHCVANRAPNPGRYRMLYETRPCYRRLFRKGDPYDPSREGSKITPEPDEIPLKYADLLKWYQEWSDDKCSKARTHDPLLELYGSGKEIWADEHTDEYVSRLREGWE